MWGIGKPREELGTTCPIEEKKSLLYPISHTQILGMGKKNKTLGKERKIMQSQNCFPEQLQAGKKTKHSPRTQSVER